MSDNRHSVTTSKTIIFVGFLLGLFLSWSLMSGDQQGRVNILHLVAIYVFLPVLSLIISLFSLSFGRGLNLATISSHVPFWGSSLTRSFLRQMQQPNSKILFLYQSQLAAIAFSVASILVFFILLITTDVNFVWRSTLLNVELVYSLLDRLAMPWSFWTSAQPSLSLLEATQDSRLMQDYSEANNFGLWWQFILASQLFYAFLLRGLVSIVCKFLMLRAQSSSSIQSLGTNNRKLSKNSLSIEVKDELATVIYKIETDYTLNNWCGLSDNLVAVIEKIIQQSSPNISRQSVLQAGPLASHSQQMISERWQETQLILVKGWEPPLAELADFMQNGCGYLLPLDWSEQGLQNLNADHLKEWRRFVIPLGKWQLLQLGLSHESQADV
ncbi:MAG: DUF2868 domain-containing protein [Kangiellaceae bacterium]|nr:DUF2868 domain-containing protein [Kangiellaceae bacterium]